jgi:hypothetical protein
MCRWVRSDRIGEGDRVPRVVWQCWGRWWRTRSFPEELVAAHDPSILVDGTLGKAVLEMHRAGVLIALSKLVAADDVSGDSTRKTVVALAALRWIQAGAFAWLRADGYSEAS